MILKDKERDFYEDLKRFVKTFGYVPTMRELCKITGYTSSSTPFRYLSILEEKGYIKRVNDRFIKFLKD